MSDITISAEAKAEITAHLSSELSESYDATRVWEAWGVGTMGPDDFAPLDLRIDDIVDGLLPIVQRLLNTGHAADEARIAELQHRLGATEELLSNLQHNYRDAEEANARLTAETVRLTDLLAVVTARMSAALTSRDAEIARLKEEQMQMTVAAIAHRGCCGCEDDQANGKIHGYCVVCGVPWPCETAQFFMFKKEDK